ncbi:MAG: ribonuclease P protein component [Clostridia bacterium]|nr:ribonuclease P protein component [Clostridia bacterium]
MKDFAEIERIKENWQFRRLYSRGKKIVTSSLIIYYSENKSDTCCLGITTGKKIGNAVNRNRAKRKIKEAFTAVYKNNKEKMKGHSFVLVARVKTKNLKSHELQAVLETELKKTAII